MHSAKDKWCRNEHSETPNITSSPPQKEDSHEIGDLLLNFFCKFTCFLRYNFSKMCFKAFDLPHLLLEQYLYLFYMFILCINQSNPLSFCGKSKITHTWEASYWRGKHVIFGVVDSISLRDCKFLRYLSLDAYFFKSKSCLMCQHISNLFSTGGKWWISHFFPLNLLVMVAFSHIAL